MQVTLSRRIMLFGSTTGFAAFLSGCNASSATSIEMAKSYASTLADALSAAAEEYIAAPSTTSAQRETVVTIVAQLQLAKSTFLSFNASSDVRAVALSLLDSAMQLLPIVNPFLGSVALYVPIALAVVRAFVDKLPPPPSAGPTPPAALVAKAAMYRHRR